MKSLYKIMLIVLLLSGCARQDPVETIINNHTEHVKESLEYSYTNFEQTTEIKYLENELESCLVAFKDIEQAYHTKIDACETKTNYWRVVSFGLILLIVGAVLLKIKKVL